MTWVSAQFFFTTEHLLIPLPAHEGDETICAFLEFSIPYRNVRPCNRRGCPACTEDEGTARNSIAGTRTYTHRYLTSIVLLKFILSEWAPRLSWRKSRVPIDQPCRHRGRLYCDIGCQCPTPNATFHRQRSNPGLVWEGGRRGTQASQEVVFVDSQA
jgi:hypothetical protein